MPNPRACPQLCPSCLSLGYCRKNRVRIVSADELKNPEYTRDVRGAAYALAVPFRRWRDFAVNEYMNFEGWIASWSGHVVTLDTGVFERPNIEYWFRDFCCTPCPPDVRPRVRREAMARTIVLATILKARNPAAAQWWGVRPANDNDPAFRKGPDME